MDCFFRKKNITNIISDIKKRRTEVRNSVSSCSKYLYELWSMLFVQASQSQNVLFFFFLVPKRKEDKQDIYLYHVIRSYYVFNTYKS